MKRYFWYEPDDNFKPIRQEMTEQEILDCYWEYWFDRMKSLGKYSQISERNCIEDFVTVHWAVRWLDEH